MQKILLWLGIVAAVLVVWLLIPDVVWQYVFFLRIPLLMGILLLILPAIAEFFLPSVLKNLFVLRGSWQIAFTILGAAVAGMAITFVVVIIISHAPDRFSVLPLPTIATFWYYALAITLALPTTFAVIDLSKEEIEPKKRWTGFFLGISLSVSLFFLFKATRAFFLATRSSDSPIGKLISGLDQGLVTIVFFLTKHSSAAGYLTQNPGTGKLQLTNATFNALVFFFVLLAIYLFVFRAYRPSAKPSMQKSEAPALFYVMVLISIAALFLGNLTFFFDYYRVSVLLFWLILTILMYGLLNVDHFFALKEDRNREHPRLDMSKNTPEV